MVEGNFGTHRYYFRRCKRVRRNCFESIQDELLFAILLRLRAQDIYFGAMLVCRKWYHITRTQYFIRTHLEQARYGLLYEENISNDFFFISPRKDGRGIDKYKLNYKIKITRDPSRSTCHGLILEYDRGFYYVTNVLTGQDFRLPPCPLTLHAFGFSGMGYDVASMTYKVVISLLDEKNRKYGYGIVTVGVDKSWRSVRIDHLSSLAGQTIRDPPVVTEGFLVWINCRGTKVVTLNLENEIMTEASPPFALLEKEKHTWTPSVLLEEQNHNWLVRCLSTGRYLTYFLQRGKFQWEVFEMKPKTAEWRKLSNICLEGQKDRIEVLVNFKSNEIDIRACGWLKYPEVLALRVRKQDGRWKFMIFYNLVTCEVGAEKVSTSTANAPFTLYKNSLVRFGGPL